MKFIYILLPIFFLNACGGSSWIKKHTDSKEEAVQTQVVKQEENITPSKEELASLPAQITKQDIQETKTNKPEVSPSKENPSETIAKTEQKTVEESPKTETPQENTEKKQNENEQIFLTSEKRLAHPWYYAKETAVGENKPKWFGEELKFDISWSFITAGKAQLNSSKIVEANGQKMYLLEAYAQSYPVIDAFFKVRDINMSWIAEDLTRSTGYWQSVKEGSYARDEWLIFDYETNSYTIHKRDKKGNIEHKPHTFEGNAVVDMLSSLYFVRNQELPLKGEVFFDIVNRGDQYPLKVVVLGKEKVKVKAGKFNCIVVEPMISGEGIFVSKGKSLKVWLTDDEYKMPVKMAVEVFIGSVKAELTEYSRK
jgi:hypothetical protein